MRTPKAKEIFQEYVDTFKEVVIQRTHFTLGTGINCWRFVKHSWIID